MPPFGAFADNVATIRPWHTSRRNWTATAARCDRQLGKRFGDNAYAAEELIA
jgi:antirestriction protein ArdC